MDQDEKRKKLVNFLNKKLFDPILEKSKDDYDSEALKRRLEEMQQSTKREKERFRQYDTPEEVRENYLNDLSSDAAEDVNEELKELDLPRLPQFKKEFLDLCKELDVTS
ncbi:MAG: hypothetical protein WBL27_10135 [Salinimicrobium sp.]